MLELLTIALNALGLLFLLLLAPIGMWWLNDPSRDAASWLDDARTLMARGDDAAAQARCRKAMTFRTSGRYSERQARTTAEAIALLTQASAANGEATPAALLALAARLDAGERALGELARQAQRAARGEPAPPPG